MRLSPSFNSLLDDIFIFWLTSTRGVTSVEIFDVAPNVTLDTSRISCLGPVDLLLRFRIFLGGRYG